MEQRQNKEQEHQQRITNIKIQIDAAQPYQRVSNEKTHQRIHRHLVEYTAKINDRGMKKHASQHEEDPELNVKDRVKIAHSKTIFFGGRYPGIFPLAALFPRDKREKPTRAQCVQIRES